MSDLNIAICEDEPLDRKLLNAILGKSSLKLNITLYSNGEDFLNDFKPHKFDLVFLDVLLGSMTGVDIATALRKREEDLLIIFTTSSTDYALDGYRLGVARYIEKPVSPSDVNDSLNYAFLECKNKKSLSVVVSSDKKTINIPYSHIVYFEQSGHSVIIHLENDEDITCNKKLDEFESILADSQESDINSLIDISEPVDISHASDSDNVSGNADSFAPVFFRCHKSYIVNLLKVEELSTEYCTFLMSDKSTVYIRRTSISSARKALDELSTQPLVTKEGLIYVKS